MRKKLFWFALVLLILGALALIFNTFFEIVQDEQIFPPSREAQVNDYLALDRLLAAEGHPVRVLSSGDLQTLKAAQEGTIFIQSDLFDWKEEAVGYLESWIEKGGSLILCLTFSRTWNGYNGYDELSAFLNRLGIAPGEESNNPYDYYLDFPSFGRNIHFKEPEDEAALILKDGSGLVRLIQICRGNGKITVTGRPRFMLTYNLDSEANARLSWYLLAGDNSPDTPGLLFIRGYERSEGLLGRIFQHGNLITIIISAIALIAAGFWSVIPIFGIVRGSEEKPAKTLTERFLAEGRFLKRFGALEHYRAVYMREIRRKLIKQNVNDKKLLEQVEALQGNKNFPESIVMLKKILECL